MADHVHMCIAIPPKYAVASVIGFLKRKSAIAIARKFVARSGISQESIFGLGGMQYPRLGLNWSRFANTSATRRKRMEQGNSSDFST